MFNTEQICNVCAREEREHPGYAEARDTEAFAVRRGEYNYPGIGLPAELQTKALLRRAARLETDSLRAAAERVLVEWEAAPVQAVPGTHGLASAIASLRAAAERNS